MLIRIPDFNIMILKENSAKTKAPVSKDSKSVKDKKAESSKVSAEDAKRAMLRAKVARELAKIKKFRSAFTSESLDVHAWHSMSEEEE